MSVADSKNCGEVTARVMAFMVEKNKSAEEVSQRKGKLAGHNYEGVGAEH